MNNNDKPGNEELRLQHWQALFDLTQNHGQMQIGGSRLWRLAERKIVCSATDTPKHLLVSRPGILNQAIPKYLGSSLSISHDPNISSAEIIEILQIHGISIKIEENSPRRRWNFFKKKPQT